MFTIIFLFIFLAFYVHLYLHFMVNPNNECTLLHDINKEDITDFANNALIITEDMYNLSNLQDYKFYINSLDDSTIILNDTKVVFKNIMNENIYPFIWLESKLEKPIKDLDHDHDYDQEKVFPFPCNEKTLVRSGFTAQFHN